MKDVCMSRKITEITNRKSIERAIAEYDEIGKNTFLSRYGYGESREYLIINNAKYYDSKAIVGVAYKYQFPNEEPLKHTEFSGGLNTVVPLLTQLKFKIESPKEQEERIYNGLLISFFISKFEKNALKILEYSNYSQAFENIGRLLNIKKNTIKNYRDEFDSAIGASRAGWHQRPPRKAIINVLNSFKLYEIEELTEIVSSRFAKYKNNQLTIAEAVYSALQNINQPSKLVDIKNYIIDNQLYDFGAQENNIDSVLNNTINRKCANSERTDKSHNIIFYKTNPNTFALLEWLNTEIDLDDSCSPDDISDQSSYEGAKIQVTVNKYERKPKNRRDCILHWGLQCAVCDFDFKKVYGDLGTGFIHVHHIKPLHEIGESYKCDPKNDLRPVCPNCHSMLHRKRNKVLSIEELKVLLNKL